MTSPKDETSFLEAEALNESQLGTRAEADVFSQYLRVGEEAGISSPRRRTKQTYECTNELSKCSSSTLLRKLAMHETAYPLSDIEETDKLYPVFAFGAVVCYLAMILSILYFNTDWHVSVDERRESLERSIPRTAFWIKLVAISQQAIHLAFRTGQQASGILIAGMTVMFVSMCSDGLLAWGPSAVVFDYHTNSRVFLYRWCEWVPLAGLMTLLAESADLPKKNHAWKGPLIYASFQSLSTFCGVIFPFCKDAFTFWVVMLFSCMLYLTIFPRLMIRCNIFNETARGKTVLEREHYDRRRIAYHLMLTCTIVWTG